MNVMNAIGKHLDRALRHLIKYTKAGLVEAGGVTGGLIIGSLHPALHIAATNFVHEAHEQARKIVQDAV
jgi:hypothetical protein